MNYNFEIERELITLLIQSEDCPRCKKVLDYLKEDHFQSDASKRVFNAIKSIDYHISPKTVYYELQKKYPKIYLDDFSIFQQNNFIPVEKLFNLQMEQYAEMQIEKIKDNDKKAITKAEEICEIKFLNYEQIQEDDTVRQLLESLEDKEKARGFDTGFIKLDENTKGLKGGHFWVIGGYSNTGKSFFSLQILNELLEQNARVAFISLEMREQDLMARLIQIKMNNGNSKEDACEDIIKKHNLLKITSKITELRDIEMFIAEENYDVYFIDFIQNIEAHGKDEFQKLSTIARTLQKLAIKHNVCIVALSQVSEDFQKNNKKITMGFKGSGAIGAAADVGLILQRNFDEEGGEKIVPFYVYLRKNRYGMTGLFTMSFNTNTANIF